MDREDNVSEVDDERLYRERPADYVKTIVKKTKAKIKNSKPIVEVIRSLDPETPLFQELSEIEIVSISDIIADIMDLEVIQEIFSLLKCSWSFEEIREGHFIITEAFTATFKRIIASVFNSGQLDKIYLVLTFLSSADQELSIPTITNLQKYLKKYSQSDFDKLNIVKLVSKILPYKDALQASKDSGLIEADEVLNLLPKILSAQAEGATDQFIETILDQFDHFLSPEVGVRAFLEKLYIVVLSQQSGAAIDYLRLQYIVKCLKSGFTTSFIKDGHKLVVDGQSYSVEFPEELDQDLEFENLVRMAFEANSDNALVAQYRDHKPLLPNTGIATKKSATDETTSKSLVDESIELNFDGWRISVVSSSNHVAAQKTSFLLLEYRDSFGFVMMYKIGKDGVVKSDTKYPLDIDTAYRKTIFGEMYYNNEKPLYYVTTIPIAIEYSKIKDFIKSLSEKEAAAISECCDSSFIEIVQILKSSEIVSEELFNQLGLHLKWEAYKKFATTKILDKKVVLDLKGPALEDFTRDETNFSTHQKVMTLEEKFAKDAKILESVIAKEIKSQEEEIEIQTIESAPYMKSFYEALRWQLNGAYLAASSIATKMIENKGTGNLGKVGTFIQKAGEYTPLVGLGVKLLGEVMVAVDKIMQAKMIDRFAHFVVDSREMAEVSEMIARKITLAKLDIKEVTSLIKSLKQFASKALDKACDLDFEELPDLPSLGKALGDEIVAHSMDKAVDKTGEILGDEDAREGVLYYAKGLFSSKGKVSGAWVSDKEKHAAQGGKDAEIVARVITSMIFKGAIGDTGNLHAKVDVIVGLVIAEYSADEASAAADSKNVEKQVDDSKEIAKNVLKKIKEHKDPNASWKKNKRLEKALVTSLSTKLKDHSNLSEEQQQKLSDKLFDELVNHKTSKAIFCASSKTKCSLDNSFLSAEEWFEGLITSSLAGDVNAPVS
ncbi:MAG UNVERIFIED_CONTAM: hypothetical protein LVQ98_08680 [Rickettsiaceae bacterium]|jgi:hypothetical protein